MSDQPSDVNPYQAATGSIAPQADQSHLVRSIAELSKWQTFLAVMMGIGTLLMIGIFTLTFISGPGPGGPETLGIVCMGLVITLVYGLPALMLWKAAAAARKCSRSPGSAELGEFAASQLNFWRTIGILVAVVVGLYGAMAIGALVFGLGISFN